MDIGLAEILDIADNHATTAYIAIAETSILPTILNKISADL